MQGLYKGYIGVIMGLYVGSRFQILPGHLEDRIRGDNFAQLEP